MSFIDAPMDDVTEPKCGPEGLYDLVVEKSDNQLDGDFRKGILLIIKVEKAPAGINAEDVANLMHNIAFPLPTDDEQKAKTKILFIKKVCHLFKIDTKGRKVSDIKDVEFIGKRAKSAKVKPRLYEGVNRGSLVLPQLPETKK